MKVFISSTYKDLIEYRAAAIRAVEGTNYQASKMEIFGARPDEPLDACLKEVEESDFFLGIYAHRYGYIPVGSEISITEMEYVHARKLGKPIYCFVIDEENQPWLPKFIEGEPGASKLKDFKRRIQTDHVCAFFTTSDDLGMKVANALSHFVANHHPISDFQAQVYQPAKPCGSTLPRQPYFFGREKELAIIADAIAPESRTWGALIDGPGGIGKTALAVQAAIDAPETLFERKIFITAKVRELKPEGEKPLTDFTRADYLSMLNELALELGEDSISRLAPEERTNALRMALANQKVLVIFDNLETLHPDERERLFQFLSRLPTGNKAIVTSRRRDNIDARVIRLERLELKESLQLMAELATNSPHLARTSNTERRQLYEITTGNPLLIKWVCGQLQRTGSHFHTITEACDFIAKAPKGNDPLEYIFGDLLETFTKDETLVLAALTYFTQPAKLEWLVQMTDLPERAAETALEDLTDRSILITNYDLRTYYLPPLAAQFIKTRRPKTVTQTGDVLVNRVCALALQYGGYDNYEGFHTLDAEWEFVSAALPRLLMSNNNRLQTICIQLDRFLDFTGRWDDWLWLSTEVEKYAIATNDKETAGWRTYWAGRVYEHRNQPAEVLACAARAAEHWQKSTPLNMSIAVRLRGDGFMLKKDYPAAISAFQEVLEIRRNIPHESVYVSTILNSLARAERLNKDFPAAERDCHEALRISKEINNLEGITSCTGQLALLALDQEQWAKAESLAHKALELAEKVGRLEFIAGDCHTLAKILLKQSGRSDWQSDLQEALSLSRRAVEIFTRLRQQDNLQLAQETLAEIERAIAGGSNE